MTPSTNWHRKGSECSCTKPGSLKPFPCPVFGDSVTEVTGNTPTPCCNGMDGMESTELMTVHPVGKPSSFPPLGLSLVVFGSLPESSKASLPHAPYVPTSHSFGVISQAIQTISHWIFPRLLEVAQLLEVGRVMPRTPGGLQKTPFPGKGQEDLLGWGAAVIEHHVSRAQLWLPQT